MRAAAAMLVGFICCGALGAEEPAVNPFAPRRTERVDAVEGRLTLSDGKEHEGRLYLTRDKRLEVFDTTREKWFKLKLKDIARISFEIEEERVEKDWRWKEGGSDVKVFTGKVYVDRKYTITVKLRSGETISGHVRGTVIYVKPAEGSAKRFFLRKDHSGRDKKPEQMVYVKQIMLGPRDANGGHGASP